jgi:hypothetical protein
MDHSVYHLHALIAAEQLPQVMLNQFADYFLVLDAPSEKCCEQSRILGGTCALSRKFFLL